MWTRIDRSLIGLYLKRVLRFFLLFVVLPMLLLQVAVQLGYAQGDTGGVDVSGQDSFPLVLIIPYALGAVLHWFKKAKETGVSFAAWFGANPVGTIISLVTGVVALTAEWILPGHGGLSPLTFATFINVFFIAFGADSLNQPASATAVKLSGGTQ